MSPSQLENPPEIYELRCQLEQSESVQLELDRRIFNLKTLYDVSKDIFSSVDSEVILRNFLLMVMGNFGVAEGALQHDLQQILSEDSSRQPQKASADGAILQPDCDPLDIIFPFEVDSHLTGALGLGPKLIDEHFNENDRELIKTLVNNLSIALQNARSIEEIKNLNRDLEAKNVQLEQAMKELRAALRKVEILESIKSNLCKFVPTAVTRLMESSPSGEIQEARERDISVLFLDIEGYTRITEEIGATEVNTLTEKYFSVFPLNQFPKEHQQQHPL